MSWRFGLVPTDWYTCVACTELVAGGDVFCRACGHRFTDAERRAMRRAARDFQGGGLRPRARARLNDLPCPFCAKRIEYVDNYCRGCGHPFGAEERGAFATLGNARQACVVCRYVAIMVAFIVFFVLAVTIRDALR